LSQGTGDPLLGVPNFSEGWDLAVVSALAEATSSRSRLLDRHVDARHGRSVVTVAAPPDDLEASLISGASRALELVDVHEGDGVHPRVGALDVCPVVFPDASAAEAADACALSVARGIAELGVPVFLYGRLAASDERRERAYFRKGGARHLAKRLGSGELTPDLGPDELHPTAGATLVTSRPPLVAFNMELDTADAELARSVAAELRESGGGPAGLRALGLPWVEGRTQISTNVHDPVGLPLADVVERTRELAEARGATVVEAEIVGLAPSAALEGFPEDIPIRDFDPDERLIERVLG